MHAAVHNEIIHSDFCTMPKASTLEKCVLIVKDDLNLYMWLIATESAEEDSVLHALTS